EQEKFLLDKFMMSRPEIEENIANLRSIREEIRMLRQRMVVANLRLVISVAYRYRTSGVPLSDLIQEGNIGLMKALSKFDSKLGNRFSTYATWWIRQSVSRAIADQLRIVRIPLHLLCTINTINKEEQKFIRKYDREPTGAELAAIMEMPAARINAIRKMARQTISLQAPISSSEDGSVLEDIVSDTEGTEPAAAYAREILMKNIRKMLETLPEREQQIIIMRFGLFGQPALSLADVSKHFNLTRERVRQLEIKILRTLRSPERIKYIDGLRQYDF
ncbi:MAG: sigma-70 family RNA polymerase sigma factor, partial [Victivallaceae bacterium]|nr:sigma-70 family RNA polymerase sigma factor [Victivallaceae bacterium]